MGRVWVWVVIEVGGGRVWVERGVTEGGGSVWAGRQKGNERSDE